MASARLSGWTTIFPGQEQSGSVDGSPIVKDNLFLGSEDPMATNKVAAGGKATCRLNRGATLHRGERLTQSFVVGVAPENQMRACVP